MARQAVAFKSEVTMIKVDRRCVVSERYEVKGEGSNNSGESSVIIDVAEIYTSNEGSCF